MVTGGLRYGPQGAAAIPDEDCREQYKISDNCGESADADQPWHAVTRLQRLVLDHSACTVGHRFSHTHANATTHNGLPSADHTFIISETVPPVRSIAA